ncbi:MAG: RsmE family RNA methyltransferase [Bacteroidales bacterium]
MNLFYATDIDGSTIILPPDESHHCLRVLRMRRGDEAVVTDGKGNMYYCTLTGSKGKEAYLLVNRIKHIPLRSYYLHLAMGCLKNHDRMEWLIEKATEVGVDEITFLNTHYTERKQVNFERLQKIAIAAMKQSQQAYLPIIHPQVVTFTHFVEQPTHPTHKYIAHCYPNVSERVLLAKHCPSGQKVLCMIGPEGDFSEEEVKMAMEKDFTPVSLGSSRLRSETAALAVCFTIAIANETPMFLRTQTQ